MQLYNVTTLSNQANKFCYQNSLKQTQTKPRWWNAKATQKINKSNKTIVLKFKESTGKDAKFA